MRVHELRNAEGALHAFEVSSLMGRRIACKIPTALPGVRVTKTYTPFTSHEGAFCEFELNGEQYIIEEPYQDSSRFWVGPKQASAASSLGSVLEHFASSKTVTRGFYIGAALVLAILVVAAYNVGSRLLQQDRCLDAGGRRNSANLACEGAMANPSIERTSAGVLRPPAAAAHVHLQGLPDSSRQ